MSNTAGLVESRKRRATKTVCSVYRAEPAGLDASEGAYAVVCEDHGAILNVATRKRAMHHAVRPDGFCEDCSVLVGDGGDESPDREPVRRVWFKTAAKRHEQTDSTYHKHGEDASPCLVCGRQTDGSRHVYVDCGYGAIVHPEDSERSMAEDPGGWMGAFPIGPDCQKRNGVGDSYLIGHKSNATNKDEA